MESRHDKFGSGMLGGVVAILLVLLLIALVVAYSGAYSVAASTGHTAGVRWMMDTTKRSSVRSHAPDDEATASLPQVDVATGTREYQAMCEHCHGGPGMEAGELEPRHAAAPAAHDRNGDPLAARRGAVDHPSRHQAHRHAIVRGT